MEPIKTYKSKLVEQKSKNMEKIKLSREMQDDIRKNIKFYMENYPKAHDSFLYVMVYGDIKHKEFFVEEDDEMEAISKDILNRIDSHKHF